MPSEQKSELLSEAVLLVAIPAFGFACCVAYQAARMAVFGVPLWLISVGPGEGFVVGFVLFGAYVLLRGALLHLPFGPWDVPLIVFTQLAAVVFLVLLPFVVPLVIPAWLAVAWFLYFCAALCYGFLEALYRPIRDRQGPWLVRIHNAAADRWNAEPDPKPSAGDAFTHSLGSAGGFVDRHGRAAFWATMVLFGALAFGGFTADQQSAYHVANTQPRPCAVVGRHDGTLICVEYHPQTQLMSGAFRLFSPAMSDTLRLAMRTVRLRRPEDRAVLDWRRAVGSR